MANALPILLLGGAALLMMGGKKKSGTAGGGQIILPPTTPPPLPAAVKKSGSGYPGLSRAQMQEVQTMLMANGYGVGAKGLDGRYGPATKQAVWEFQEDWGQGLVVDGKPGSKTRAALKQAEAGRLDALPGSSGDQCDPLDPGAWGAGNVCVFDGSRWVREKAQVKAASTPKAGFNEVVFSSDFSEVDIGGGWVLNVMHPWLKEQAEEGKLSMVHNWSKSWADLLWNDPYNFWLSGLGFPKGGDFASVMETIVVDPYKPAMHHFNAAEELDSRGKDSSGQRRSGYEKMVGVIVSQVSLGGIAGLTIAGMGLAATVPLAITSVFWSLAGTAGSALDHTHREALQETASWATVEFWRTHYVRVGNKKMTIMAAAESGAILAPGFLELGIEIAYEVRKFQKLHLD